MAEEQLKKVEAESPALPAPAAHKNDVAEEKAVVTQAGEEKPDESKALAVVESKL